MVAATPALPSDLDYSSPVRGQPRQRQPASNSLDVGDLYRVWLEARDANGTSPNSPSPPAARNLISQRIALAAAQQRWANPPSPPPPSSSSSSSTSSPSTNSFRTAGSRDQDDDDLFTDEEINQLQNVLETVLQPIKEDLQGIKEDLQELKALVVGRVGR